MSRSSSIGTGRGLMWAGETPIGPEGIVASKRRPKGAGMPRKATEAAATTKKTAAKKTVTRRAKKTETTEPVLTWEHVATRAYYISLDQGGDPFENWLRAERELVAA